jgi:ribulose-phosphate 3-epimerase
MSSVIVPAILPTSRKDLEGKLQRLAGLAAEVQVDIVDGYFAQPACWPYTEGERELRTLPAFSFPCLGDFGIEVDLMVRDPERTAGAWIEAGATRILAHLESTPNIPQLLDQFVHRYGHEKGFASGLLSVGLAMNVGTDLALLGPYIPTIDYIQLMGIKNIGKQGQPFAQEVLQRIKLFRSAYPDMPIQVDGGVNKETAPQLLEAGVSRLVIGSALWNAQDTRAAYAEFVALTEQYGFLR